MNFMSSIDSFGLYQCPNCQQIHAEPIYRTINFASPPPINKQQLEELVCQGCSTQMQLKNFNYLGAVEKEQNRGVFSALVCKIGGGEKRVNPADQYPRLSDRPFDLDFWIEAFNGFGIKPEDYPTWFKKLNVANTKGGF